MVNAYRRVPREPKASDTVEEGRLPLRRNSPELQAQRAQVLLDDPRLRGIFDTAREEALAELEAAPMDGSPASEAMVLEKVRQLQALLRVKQIIMRPLLAEQDRSGGSPA